MLICFTPKHLQSASSRSSTSHLWPSQLHRALVMDQRWRSITTYSCLCGVPIKKNKKSEENMVLVTHPHWRVSRTLKPSQHLATLRKKGRTMMSKTLLHRVSKQPALMRITFMHGVSSLEEKKGIKMGITQ